MTDIQKEQFAFELYNDLQDEFGMVDQFGGLARQIQEATGEQLDNIIRTLQAEMVRNIRIIMLV